MYAVLPVDVRGMGLVVQKLVSKEGKESGGSVQSRGQRQLSWLPLPAHTTAPSTADSAVSTMSKAIHHKHTSPTEMHSPKAVHTPSITLPTTSTSLTGYIPVCAITPDTSDLQRNQTLTVTPPAAKKRKIPIDATAAALGPLENRTTYSAASSSNSTASSSSSGQEPPHLGHGVSKGQYSHHKNSNNGSSSKSGSYKHGEIGLSHSKDISNDGIGGTEEDLFSCSQQQLLSCLPESLLEDAKQQV